jgi:hypothetical protein
VRFQIYFKEEGQRALYITGWGDRKKGREAERKLIMCACELEGQYRQFYFDVVVFDSWGAIY